MPFITIVRSKIAIIMQAALVTLNSITVKLFNDARDIPAP